MSHRYKTLHKGDTSGDVNEALSAKDTKKLNKASVLSYSDDPKDQHRARVRQAEIDFKDLMRQRAKKKKAVNEAVLEVTDKKKKKKEAELRRLLQHAIAVKKGQAESFEIDTSAHKKAQKKAKMRNLARGNENPNEKAAAEKKAGGPKLMGEGKRWDSYKKAVATVLSKKKEEKKPEKAMDAGARAKRKLQRKEYRSKVSPFIPDELKD